ncbi:PP2C family protein-serine/threonine phosphatase [Streptomyces celluloflavus]|uniref:PP2C family protein-serine/threonine phosphatase n=1 Tax=Streptomyces celluloflavus TaxID=58344 RepID=UPI0036DE56FE
MITTGHATREGTDADNADAARVYRLADGTVGAAVIDGIGHGPHTSRTAPLLAEVAARITARRGTLPGLLAAGDLVADHCFNSDEADAVAVTALACADRDTSVAWVGDCRAYGWNGARLRQYSTDHTMGQMLRLNGAPWDLAEDHDNWIRTSLSRATVATVYEADIPATELVILTTDGIHDDLPHDEMEDLVREHAADPQALADALVAATRADDDGYRDDATTIVLAIHQD